MNYTVWPSRGWLGISPGIKDDEGERISEIMNVNAWGEVEGVSNRADALRALYNQHQVVNAFHDGDTFTWRGAKVPFAYVSGVDVMPFTGRRYGGWHFPDESD